MYKFAIFAVSFLFFTSCTSNVEIPQQQLRASDILGEWQLVRTFGQIPNSERTGDEMYWQESYTLRADGTFTKRRFQDGELFVAEGTFILENINHSDGQPDHVHLSMIYSSVNPLIGSCYTDSLEELWFRTEEVLASTWHQCDGPGLEYEKKEGN